MVGKVVDDPFDGFFDPCPVGVIEGAAIDVELSRRFLEEPRPERPGFSPSSEML
jgi:hypothetical protein